MHLYESWTQTDAGPDYLILGFGACSQPQLSAQLKGAQLKNSLPESPASPRPVFFSTGRYCDTFNLARRGRVKTSELYCRNSALDVFFAACHAISLHVTKTNDQEEDHPFDAFSSFFPCLLIHEVAVASDESPRKEEERRRNEGEKQGRERW
eukprot:g8169.t1